jgi:hypothetical protein
MPGHFTRPAIQKEDIDFLPSHGEQLLTTFHTANILTAPRNSRQENKELPFSWFMGWGGQGEV